MSRISRTHFAGLIVAGLLGASAQADVITLPSTSATQGRINSSFGQGGNIGDGRSIRAGTTGANVEFRGFMVFDTTSYAGPTDSATLTYDLAVLLNSPGNYEVYGVSVDAGFDGTINTLAERTAIYQSPGTANATLLSTEAAVTGVVNIDATSFVAAERTAGNNIVAFVFAEVSPSSDGTADLIQIIDANDPSSQGQEPSLTIVPEPSSLALLGLGGLLIARRRRG